MVAEGKARREQQHSFAPQINARSKRLLAGRQTSVKGYTIPYPILYPILYLT
jgi:hypothetical protein